MSINAYSVAVCIVVVAIALLPTSAQATCPPPLPASGNDMVICDDTTGSLTSGVYTGDGNDSIHISGSITLSGYPSAIYAGSGDDTLTITGDSTITLTMTAWGVIDLGSGDDDLTVSGNANVTTNQSAPGILSGDGNDQILISGDAVVSAPWAAVQDQSYTAGDTNQIAIIENAQVSGGTTGIAISGPATSSGQVVVWDATVTGGTTGILTGGGNDTVTVLGNGTVSGGTQAVNLGGGNDSMEVMITGTINGEMFGGAGIDTIAFDGTTTDSVGWAQLQSYVGCTACSGTVTIDGQTFSFSGFEGFVTYVTLLAQPGSEVIVTINDGRLNAGVGDWLVVIYPSDDQGHPGIHVRTPTSWLWVPQERLPAVLPQENQQIACSAEREVCLYQLTTGEYQVNVTSGGMSLAVAFDGLSPTHVYPP